jgi:bla regulator protein blaR1
MCKAAATARRCFPLQAFVSVAALVMVAVQTVSISGQVVPDQSDWEKAAGGKKQFEVASIHPGEPGTHVRPPFTLDPADSPIPPGGRFSANFPLIVYIMFAYKIWPTPELMRSWAAELPKWAQSETFVIDARASGNPTKDQMRLMLQALLAERFNLRVHYENRDTPIFALVLAKPGAPGPNLRPHSEGPPCDEKVSLPVPGTPLSSVPAIFPAICHAYAGWTMGDNQRLFGARDTTMPEIAASFGTSGQQGRPIVDQTGLKGTFDFTLHYVMEPNTVPTPEGDTQSEIAGPTFLEALQDQLGLKLKATNAPVRTLVIDHVEQPSPN